LLGAMHAGGWLNPVRLVDALPSSHLLQGYTRLSTLEDPAEQRSDTPTLPFTRQGLASHAVTVD
jgi:hypothetical protein